MNHEALIFFFDAMKLMLLNHLPSSTIRINDDVFEDVYQNEIEATIYDGFLGFYDWLINSRSEAIGVYLALSDFSEGLVDYLKRCHNVEIEEDQKGVFIFFASDRDYDEEFSCSQSFGCNRMYKNGDGKLAMSFGLPEASLEKILGLDLC